MNNPFTNCLLCDHTEAALKHSAQIGYQANEHFAIYHCPACVTAFALPMQVNENIYNLIYKHSQIIPGYERYQRYAKAVLATDNPLDYLAKSEDVYWAIKKYLISLKKSNPKILEVGCGLGYLTYALHKAGYDVTGIDISKVAINQAKERYEDNYICKDVGEHAQEAGAIYDVIIFTEVIEHIPNVKSFIASLISLLKPKGELVLTTPNRSCFANEILWETEPPPVHLWWFSENSIQHLAKFFGYQASFIDYSEYYPTPLFMILGNDTPFKPTRTSRLDAHGNVIDLLPLPLPEKKWKKLIKSSLNSVSLLSPLRKIKRWVYTELKAPTPNIELKIKVDPKRSFALCAILSR